MKFTGKVKTTKILVFVFIIIVGIISCIHPIYPNEQFLQHLGTIILLAILVIDLRKNNLTLAAFVFFSVYILLHIIGARYIYSYVPYDKWLNSIIQPISGKFIDVVNDRNAYDRFVHLAYGILVFPIVYENLKLRKTGDRFMLVVSTWAILQSISMLYEVFEWGLTLVLSPEAANDYNGQQGDFWDAQKDMFLAMLGSTFMAFYFMVFSRNRPYRRDK